MAHTVIPPPRGTTATLELTHKGNINDKTIPERDREIRDFNVTLFAIAIRLGLKKAFLFPSQISHISRKREAGRPFGLGPTLSFDQ